MLCEICQKREATIHTGNGSEGQFSDHFCPECFQTRGPIPGIQIVQGVVQTCHYCGARCDFGCSSPQGVSVELPGSVTACRECGEDLNRYVQNNAQQASSGEQFLRDLEAYMKKRVAERNGEP
jgi:protein-arginine kinase activator protein McsA